MVEDRTSLAGRVVGREGKALCSVASATGKGVYGAWPGALVRRETMQAGVRITLSPRHVVARDHRRETGEARREPWIRWRMAWHHGVPRTGSWTEEEKSTG